jgi:hypothetical protein
MPFPLTLPPPVSSSIALIDARFLHWLLGQGSPQEDDEATLPPEPSATTRIHLAQRLEAALHQAGVHAQLARVYWYTSHPEPATAAGQVVRQVPAEAEDGGAGLVLALARDAQRLAQGGACAHLLLASDDDRLLPTVDHLQQQGVQVHLLADRSAADLLALARTDPSWASLLKLADSRPMLDASEKAPRQRGQMNQAAQSDAIQALVQRWLDSLPPAQRDLFRASLPRERGLPQEADRELLVEISQHLGRPLQVPERKLMRELAREALEERPPGSALTPQFTAPHPVQSRPCEEPSSSPSAA